MSPQPSIRVNAGAPFPTLVQGSGPVTVTKVNGIWRLGFSVVGIATKIPPLNQLSADYVLFWDTNAQQFFNLPLSAFFAVLRPQRAIRSIADLPITANDAILNIGIGAPLAISVPAYTTRNGAPLTYKNRPTSTANATLNRTGTDTFDGLTSIVLAPSQSVTLMPDNDGVNASGYSIE